MPNDAEHTQGGESGQAQPSGNAKGRGYYERARLSLAKERAAAHTYGADSQEVREQKAATAHLLNLAARHGYDPTRDGDGFSGAKDPQPWDK